jgi:integrase/recombinase XerD
VLTVAEVQAILDACDHRRDRLLFALMWESGMRVGEALGLRHQDIAAAEREITIVPRINDNRARSKSGQQRTVPVSPGLIRLYGDYLHGEYGDLDSDYVFVNLFAEPRGQALSYPAVYDLVARLRRRTGLRFGPHWCRHSAATRMQGRGVASDATFRAGREDGVAGPAGPGGRSGDRDDRANPQARTAVTGQSCVRCQDVASTLVASDARIVW